MRGYMDKYFILASYIVFFVVFTVFYFQLSRELLARTLEKASYFPSNCTFVYVTKEYYYNSSGFYRVNGSYVIESNCFFSFPLDCIEKENNNTIKLYKISFNCLPFYANGTKYILRIILK